MYRYDIRCISVIGGKGKEREGKGGDVGWRCEVVRKEVRWGKECIWGALGVWRNDDCWWYRMIEVMYRGKQGHSIDHLGVTSSLLEFTCKDCRRYDEWRGIRVDIAISQFCCFLRWQRETWVRLKIFDLTDCFGNEASGLRQPTGSYTRKTSEIGIFCFPALNTHHAPPVSGH